MVAPVSGRQPRDPDLTAMLQALGITVLVPGNLEYERAVASSNLLYRFARPTYVIRPKTADHVTTIVKEAVKRKYRLTIKNGGHSYIGSSYPNDGIMLDLKEMNHVALDRCVSELSNWVDPKRPAFYHPFFPYNSSNSVKCYSNLT